MGESNSSVSEESRHTETSSAFELRIWMAVMCGRRSPESATAAKPAIVVSRCGCARASWLSLSSSRLEAGTGAGRPERDAPSARGRQSTRGPRGCARNALHVKLLGSSSEEPALLALAAVAAAPALSRLRVRRRCVPDAVEERELLHGSQCERPLERFGRASCVCCCCALLAEVELLVGAAVALVVETLACCVCGGGR